MLTLSPDHPRPQLQRASWETLNGRWDFAIDRLGAWDYPDNDAWTDAIQVPFAPETPLSGVQDAEFFRACWYRRTVAIAPPVNGEHVILHFGAVDYAARVWVDGHFAGDHMGGFTPFSIDITALLGNRADHGREHEHEIVVRAEDDPHDLAQPRGKQDWQLLPHAIWYPRTSGIWQTVWIERCPPTWIKSLRWTASLVNWDLACEVTLGGERRDDLRLEVVLSVAESDSPRLLAHDVYAVVANEVHRRIALSDPGIDDYRNQLLWSPDMPTLIDATLRLLDRQGNVIDEAASYTAMRTVAVDRDRFMLNGRPLYLRLILDQGYWPESGMTPPDSDALRHNVELAKAMGFNGVRKHQKIEDPRYFYWADHLGLLVWEEMPSAYRFTETSMERLLDEWIHALQRDISHPCVVTWVPFNESWGVPDLPSDPPQRHFIQGLYHLTKALDASRPVVGNDGWESTETDIIGIHDYEQCPQRLRERYAAQSDIAAILQRVRPGGRVSTLDGYEHAGQPVVLSEFGGISYAESLTADDDSWGYSEVESPVDLERAYAALLAAVHGLPFLAGFCYTQFADTYQETNGLLFANRIPKVPLTSIAEATEGPRRAARGRSAAAECEDSALVGASRRLVEAR